MTSGSLTRSALHCNRFIGRLNTYVSSREPMCESEVDDMKADRFATRVCRNAT